MAINPPGDIVLGVANAADPLKYQAAADRLARMSGTAGAEGAERAAPSTGVADVSPPRAAPSPKGAAPSLPAVRRTSQPRGNGEALGQFEAFVLQTFIQSMLPSNAASVFGKGTAGEVWKSMMAEQLARELARSGQVGIARQMTGGASVGRDDGARHEPAVSPAAPVRPTASIAGFLAYLETPLVDASGGHAVGATAPQPPTDRS